MFCMVKGKTNRPPVIKPNTQPVRHSDETDELIKGTMDTAEASYCV